MKVIQKFEPRSSGPLPGVAVVTLEKLGLVGGDRLAGDPAHGSKVVLGILDLHEDVGVLGLRETLDDALKHLLVLVPLLNLRV